jgi:hypothetical protein
VDLLEFPNFGRFEKVAWSVPIEFKGKLFAIEHRKFGIGVFAQDASKEEEQAREIVQLIKKGVKTAEPFFEWLAEQAVMSSKLNVINRSSMLFDRFTFLLNTYRKTAAEAIARKDERHVETKEIPSETGKATVTAVHMPAWELESQANWFALAAIDAFFSWTEHIFIHIAIISGQITSGMAVAELAEADWSTKFKRALDVTDPTTKSLFDKLIEIRRQFRNFVAHGAFGKEGEAFQFHSGAGAVPVLLPHKAGKRRFALTGGMNFGESTALDVIEEFIAHIWSNEREPAEIYIQNSGLPLILPMASDGTYARAMSSVEDMNEFIESLSRQFDNAANMDFW